MAWALTAAAQPRSALSGAENSERTRKPAAPVAADDVDFFEQGSRLRATWRGREPRVLHFSGGAKRKYPQWQGKFSIEDPLAGKTTGDSYAVFVEALRAWLGRHGVNALAWSFYGLTSGDSAVVKDPSTMPLLATLHYVIRANGCVRVLETGTARGISAACLASAVAHRSQVTGEMRRW